MHINIPGSYHGKHARYFYQTILQIKHVKREQKHILTNATLKVPRDHLYACTYQVHVPYA